jgi:hypothetical protein
MPRPEIALPRALLHGASHSLEGLHRVVKTFPVSIPELLDDVLGGAIAFGSRSGFLLAGRELDAL